MWRNTQEDGYVPVFNYIDYKKELSKKELKDYKSAEQMALEKFVKINVTEKAFQANQVVYCSDLKNYVQIKEVIATEKKTAANFEVRILDDSSKGENSKNEVQQVSLERLSVTITVNVFAISAKGEQHEISMLDVNINDKLQTLVDLLAMDNISGTFVSSSQILSDEKLDQTFAKLFIKNGEKIGVMQGEARMKEPIKYLRFAAYTNYADTIYNFREDAICFVPK